MDRTRAGAGPWRWLRRRSVVQGRSGEPASLPGAASKSLPFDSKPPLERRIAHVQTVEQIAPIEIGRLNQRLGRSGIDQMLEPPGIDLDGRRIEADAITLGGQERRVGISQHLAQFGEHLAKA
jgi:hypothetical protein